MGAERMSGRITAQTLMIPSCKKQPLQSLARKEEKLRREERVEEEVVVCDGFGQNVHRIVVLVGQIQADVHGIVGVVVGSRGAVAGMVHVFRIAVTWGAGI